MIEPNSNERIGPSPVAWNSLHYNTLQLGDPAEQLLCRVNKSSGLGPDEIIGRLLTKSTPYGTIGGCGVADRSRSLRQFTNQRFGRLNHNF
jgi:hypothetical protein